MDVATAIATHRVVRAFDDRQRDPSTLRSILDAGRRAGSAKNRQRWDFIVCREREHLRALAELGPYAGHLAGAAVAVALVTPDPHRPEAPLSVVWDLGGAAAQMMLAAWELGIGSCPATVYDQELARRLLGHPDGHWCEYVLSFGYPEDPSVLSRPNRPGGRKPLDAILHEERW
jgi:nitroreductase